MKNISYVITDQKKFSENVKKFDLSELKPTDNNEISGSGELQLQNGEKVEIKGITKFDKYQKKYGFVLIKC